MMIDHVDEGAASIWREDALKISQFVLVFLSVTSLHAGGIRSFRVSHIRAPYYFLSPAGDEIQVEKVRTVFKRKFCPLNNEFLSSAGDCLRPRVIAIHCFLALLTYGM